MQVGKVLKISELKEIVEKGGNRQLLDHVGPHQYIWSQNVSDLQPADVGQTRNRICREERAEKIPCKNVFFETELMKLN